MMVLPEVLGMAAPAEVRGNAALAVREPEVQPEMAFIASTRRGCCGGICDVRWRVDGCRR